MPENLTDEQKSKLTEMLDTWDSVHRAVKFLVFLGRILRWIAGLGSAAAVIYSAFHGGSPK